MAIRITQAGLGLTVGIIVVAALIIGGFFVAKNAGEQARRDEAINIAEQNLEKQSGDEVALNEGAKNESENKDNGKEMVPSDTSKNTASGQQVTELPQTGPADQFVSILILGALTFSVASYLTSRKAL